MTCTATGQGNGGCIRIISRVENDDLIAGLDVQAQQRKMNGGRTRRKGKGMPSAGESTDVLLEPVDLGAKGRHPSGRDRSCQSLHLKVGHVRL